ncbi:MAG: TetR/AcrR family transcriptional regulator [Acidimicrobiales bacterium]|nr:TetR/AcrR family transcriptional regulator [Acidimicrobiales bacterium]
MTDEHTRHLRNAPRQARSAARVELLLDVAAEVFEEVGYDSATTNLVAARAGVPVGSLYRWFPDKAALAEALTDRYLDQLVGVYAAVLVDLDPGERVGEFIPRVISRLLDEMRSQRAMSALLVSAMVPGGRSHAGARLRSGLQASIAGLIEARVPGVPDDVRDRTAEVCTTLAHLVIASAFEADADMDPADRDQRTGEYIDVMLAYLEAKFPDASHPAWTDPDAAVKPLFPAPDRAARLARHRPGDA